MNITYLFGAGASANASPILKGQGEKMVELAKEFLDPELALLFNSKPMSIDTRNRILFDFGYFGTKALQYVTIDTYAKKLYLSDDHENELDRLKLSVSLFFTIWESMNNDYKIKDNFQNIDPRYISLLASVLEKTQSKDPKIKPNIKFITWNYDLQFERAFKSFCMSNLGWDYVSKNLYFRIYKNDKGGLDICHLNGYNDFYYTEKRSNDTIKEVDTIDRISENHNIQSILKELEFTVESQNRDQISFANHINYAWESNDLAQTTREAALEIFGLTDVLVVIGYSFPPFNKEIDQQLFRKLKGRKTKVYYQDPNASEEFISILVNNLDTEIYCITDKFDHFFLPYDF